MPGSRSGKGCARSGARPGPRKPCLQTLRRSSMSKPISQGGLALHSLMKAKLTTIPAPSRRAESEFRTRNYHVRIECRGSCWIVDCARDILAHQERDRFIPVSKDHWQKVRISRLSRDGPPFKFLMQISSHTLVTLQEIASCFREGDAQLPVILSGSTRLRKHRWHARVAEKLAAWATRWRVSPRTASVSAF